MAYFFICEGGLFEYMDSGLFMRIKKAGGRGRAARQSHAAHRLAADLEL